ncbi:helix-turn-helix transcriptional regulator [Yersinia bercovieri]|uniref:helix-turn-helix transcriptional regulator n=1 Tax=Yersinia bercovieri TaxID=634 RepID=UPI00119D097B|nr:hypothetical protein [Yersinia bercovieri]MCB5304093.1 hypothetical protein [Yersinia bercovieri]
MAKRIVIYSECPHAALGLASLCQNLPGKSDCQVVMTLDALHQALIQPIVTLLLCVAKGTTEEMAGLLEMSVPKYCHRGSVTLHDTPVLKRMFDAAGFDMVLSAREPLASLAERLRLMWRRTPQQYKQQCKKATIYLAKERAVLCELLRGKNLHYIADNFGLSYNSVSRYKQRGLRRTGIDSLNAMICELNGNR